MSESSTVRSSHAHVLDLVYCAFGAALIAICSWISIPTQVPFTLQTMAVFLVCALLGGRRGTIAVLIYILLGAAGVPVFAGFTGGISRLAGPTGGYIIGFLGSALLYWAMEKIPGKRLWIEVLSMVLGLFICYAFGTVWFYLVYNRGSGSMGWAAVLTACVYPFLIPDAIKIAVAVLLSQVLRPLLKEKA